MSSSPFTNGTSLEVCAERVYLRESPSPSASIDTELFFGTPVLVAEAKDGWAHVQSRIDQYEGFTESKNLVRQASRRGDDTEEMIVSVPLCLGYSHPSATAPASFAFPMGSRLQVYGKSEQEGFVPLFLQHGEREQKAFVKLTKIFSKEQSCLEHKDEWVDKALLFLNAPYLYGGCCYAGIDCSALLQVSLGVHGVDFFPRDTHEQEEWLDNARKDHYSEMLWEGQKGKNSLPDDLKKGDVVVWNKHIGVMLDEKTLLHANAGAMAVAKEPLQDARGRIMSIEGDIKSIWRMFLDEKWTVGPEE